MNSKGSFGLEIDPEAFSNKIDPVDIARMTNRQGELASRLAHSGASWANATFVALIQVLAENNLLKGVKFYRKNNDTGEWEEIKVRIIYIPKEN